MEEIEVLKSRGTDFDVACPSTVIPAHGVFPRDLDAGEG